MTGSFKDWNYNNEVSVSRSSNAEDETYWLRIKSMRGDSSDASAQLTIEDCEVLISILKKAIADSKRY